MKHSHHYPDLYAWTDGPQKTYNVNSTSLISWLSTRDYKIPCRSTSSFLLRSILLLESLDDDITVFLPIWHDLLQ